MSSISILKVAGNDLLPISIVKQHLTRHFPSEDTSTTSTSNITNVHHDHNDDHALTTPVQLFIENKYFEANLLLEHCDYNHTKHDATTIRIVDGILLIFNHFNTSIDTLTDIHNRICDNHTTTNNDNDDDNDDNEEIKDTIGDALRLCISTSPSAIEPSKANEEIYSQRVLWCLDRGYEYIEVDLSEEGMKVRPEVREKDGFDRVVEAIGSTVWRSAIMKHSSVRSALLDTDRHHGQEHEQEQERASISSTTGNECESSTLKEKRLEEEEEEEEEEQEQEEEEEQEQEQQEQQEQHEKKIPKSKEEKSEEVLMNEFEMLMNEAKRIREASRNGDLSDQERRDRAGNAAQMLMGLLDQMGFDDDDDEDEDNSSSDEE